MYKKITETNGFDKYNKDNAKQNNYAWSMAEFNGYIYVGTGRNIVALGLQSYGLHPLDIVTPEEQVNLAEIWRYPVKSYGVSKWEFVYRADANTKIYGFRDMSVYTDINGTKGLVIGCVSLDKQNAYIIYSTDGVKFNKLYNEMPKGCNSRAFCEYKGKLYCGVNNTLGGEQTSILVMDSFKDGFREIDLPTGDNNPKGNIMSMVEFNRKLYIGTANGEGFSVWKTSSPESGYWELVVDKGTGDALNEWAMTMTVYKNYLYVGSAITGGTISVVPGRYVPFKGFDLVRIDEDDNWEVVIGSNPISPTEPTKGKRNKAENPSGMGNAFSNYCWQMHVYNNKLYVSTWDSLLTYKLVIANEIKNGMLNGLGLDENDPLSIENISAAMEKLTISSGQYQWLTWIMAVVKSLNKYPRENGFDLYVSQDGVNFKAETKNGFHNKYNYGLRTMLDASDGKLYLGTANPFEGCEVWTLDSDFPHCDCKC